MRSQLRGPERAGQEGQAATDGDEAFPARPAVLRVGAAATDAQGAPGGDIEGDRGAGEPGACEARACRFVLDWPPSVNTIWRHIVIKGAARVVLSKDGREYRERAAWAVRSATRGVRFDRGPVSVEIVAYPPDRRARDIDNILKAALDAITHSGLWRDDSQVASLSIERRETRHALAGKLIVTVREAATAQGALL